MIFPETASGTQESSGEAGFSATSSAAMTLLNGATRTCSNLDGMPPAVGA